MSIDNFKGRGTKDIYDGEDTPQADKVLPRNLWLIARDMLDHLHSVKTLGELASVNAYRLEKLVAGLKGRWSIRINQKYRIVFNYDSGQAKATNVFITNHYGKD